MNPDLEITAIHDKSRPWHCRTPTCVSYDTFMSTAAKEGVAGVCPTCKTEASVKTHGPVIKIEGKIKDRVGMTKERTAEYADYIQSNPIQPVLSQVKKQDPLPTTMYGLPILDPYYEMNSTDESSDKKFLCRYSFVISTLNMLRGAHSIGNSVRTMIQVLRDIRYYEWKLTAGNRGGGGFRNTIGKAIFGSGPVFPTDDELFEKGYDLMVPPGITVTPVTSLACLQVCRMIDHLINYNPADTAADIANYFGRLMEALCVIGNKAFRTQLPYPGNEQRERDGSVFCTDLLKFLSECQERLDPNEQMWHRDNRLKSILTLTLETKLTCVTAGCARTVNPVVSTKDHLVLDLPWIHHDDHPDRQKMEARIADPNPNPDKTCQACKNKTAMRIIRIANHPSVVCTRIPRFREGSGEVDNDFSYKFGFEVLKINSKSYFPRSWVNVSGFNFAHQAFIRNEDDMTDAFCYTYKGPVYVSEDLSVLQKTREKTVLLALFQPTFEDPVRTSRPSQFMYWQDKDKEFVDSGLPDGTVPPDPGPSAAQRTARKVYQVAREAAKKTAAFINPPPSSSSPPPSFSSPPPSFSSPPPSFSSPPSTTVPPPSTTTVPPSVVVDPPSTTAPPPSVTVDPPPLASPVRRTRTSVIPPPAASPVATSTRTSSRRGAAPVVDSTRSPVRIEKTTTVVTTTTTTTTKAAGDVDNTELVAELRKAKTTPNNNAAASIEKNAKWTITLDDLPVEKQIEGEPIRKLPAVAKGSIAAIKKILEDIAKKKPPPRLNQQLIEAIEYFSNQTELEPAAKTDAGLALFLLQTEIDFEVTRDNLERLKEVDGMTEGAAEMITDILH